MSKLPLYKVIKSIGTFADESGFKKKYMDFIFKNPDRFKTVLAIENTVEPGMPDLIIVDKKSRSVFVEVKYARRGVITFKRTQIPWYRRHQNLYIVILAYNDKTKNIHMIDSSIVLLKAQNLCVKLEEESNFIIEEFL